MGSRTGEYELVQMPQRNAQLRQSFRCSKELRIVLRNKNLLARPGNREFDQIEIREQLRAIDAKQWESVLHELMREGSFFMNDGCFQQEHHRKDLISFLDNLLFAIVEDDLDEHLKPTMQWLETLKEIHDYLDNDTLLRKLYENNVAMSRACKKRDVETVFALFWAGFRLKTKLETRALQKLNEDELMLEISNLEVRASHAYLLAETYHRVANSRPDNSNWVIGNDQNVGEDVEGTINDMHIRRHDTINTAMELIRICSKLEQTRRGAIKKVDNVKKGLEKFLVKMLDLCRPHEDPTKDEITLFLNKDDHIEGIFIKGTSLLPRINQSLMLHLQEFVTHDYCQQAIRKEYYGESSFKKKTGTVLFLLVVFQLFIATPIGWALHFLSKLNIIKTEALPVYFNMDVPLNRLVSHALVQLAFVTIILTALVNPHDTKCVFDPNIHYNGLGFAMAIGLLVSNLEEMFQLARCTKIDYNTMNCLEIASAYCKRFFGNGFYNYRLLGLVLLLTGAAMRAIGYKSFDKTICLQSGGSYYLFENDDYSCYRGSVVEVGTCLQGSAVVIILSQLLQFLRLHPRVSAIFEGMRKCCWDVFSYGFTYIVITLTFSAGLYFVLHDAMGECTTRDDPIKAQEIYETCIQEEKNWIKNDTDCSNRKDTTLLSYTGTQDENNTRKTLNSTCEMFFTFHNTTKYLFLNAFDPGYPEQLNDCTSGISRDVGFVMWYLYYFLVAVVLINLLIALMNTTLNNIESLDTWMYHRTLLWMRFCSKNAVVLPPPINLINYMISEVQRRWHNPEDFTDGSDYESKYQKLMDDLVTRYANDMDTFEDNDVAMRDKLDNLERDINEIKDRLNEVLAAVTA